jgi:hypothetical protein
MQLTAVPEAKRKRMMPKAGIEPASLFSRNQPEALASKSSSTANSIEACYTVSELYSLVHDYIGL